MISISSCSSRPMNPAATTAASPTPNTWTSPAMAAIPWIGAAWKSAGRRCAGVGTPSRPR